MRQALQRILGLVRKEILTILKDRRSRAILIVPVIVQSIVFGYAASFDLTHVPYALLDRSPSAETRRIVGQLDGTGVFERVATLRSSAQAGPVIESGKALMVIVFAPTFAADLHAGRQATIQVLLDGRNSTTASAALGALADIVGAGDARQRLPGPALRIESIAWFNPNLETRWHLVPSLIASLSMLQTLLLTALSVAREREEGSFDQLLVTPLSPAEIMLGKALPSILIGLAQAALVLLVARFWFQIPFAGSLATLGIGLALFMSACVGIGLAISALSASMQQAMLYTFVLVMPMMLLSGLTTPVANMPGILRTVTLANPLRFAIDLVRRVYLEGASLATVSLDLVPMLAIAGITLPLAAWLFRNKLT